MCAAQCDDMNTAPDGEVDHEFWHHGGDYVIPSTTEPGSGAITQALPLPSILDKRDPKRDPRRNEPKIFLATMTVSDEHILRKYYWKGFEMLRQYSCKAIAKDLIRAVEPSKRTLYPYNRRYQGQLRQGESPPWWPEGVSHREPDHLVKGGETMPDTHTSMYLTGNE